MAFDPHQIMNLVGQLGGNHQQAAQQLQGLDQVDPQQHAGMLNQLGVDPQQLQNGGYQQQLDAQQQSGFQGYQPSGDYTNQQPSFSGQQAGGQEQASGYEQGGQEQGSGQEQGGQEQGSGYEQGGQEPGSGLQQDLS